MNLSSNYNEFLEILREKCKTQRKLMNYSQEKVCQILEERYGLVKDVSKISLYESGKTRNPDFLPEYCEILNIRFPDMLCKNMEGHSMIEKNTTDEVVEAAEVGTEEKIRFRIQIRYGIQINLNMGFGVIRTKSNALEKLLSKIYRI